MSTVLSTPQAVFIMLAGVLGIATLIGALSRWCGIDVDEIDPIDEWGDRWR